MLVNESVITLHYYIISQHYYSVAGVTFSMQNCYLSLSIFTYLSKGSGYLFQLWSTVMCLFNHSVLLLIHRTRCQQFSLETTFYWSMIATCLNGNFFSLRTVEPKLLLRADGYVAPENGWNTLPSGHFPCLKCMEYNAVIWSHVFDWDHCVHKQARNLWC